VVVPAHRLEVGLYRHAVVGAARLQVRVHALDGGLQVLGAVDGRVVRADRPTDQVHGPLRVRGGGDKRRQRHGEEHLPHGLRHPRTPFVIRPLVTATSGRTEARAKPCASGPARSRATTANVTVPDRRLEPGSRAVSLRGQEYKDDPGRCQRARDPPRYTAGRGAPWPQSTSRNSAAMPWPPPTHIEMIPCSAPLRRISAKRSAAMRAPVAPNGCPIAIAPPLTFSFSSGKIGRASCRERV